MIRYAALFVTLIAGLTLLACQAEEAAPPVAALDEATVSAPTLTATPTPVTVKLVTPAPAGKTPPPTPTSTFTPSATPTPTPTPTNTPVPSQRRSNARRAFHNGDYRRAQEDFNALLDDPGASADDRRQALYWRGRSELALNTPNAAAGTFAQFLKQYPDEDLTRPARFNYALALEATGQYTPSIAAYQASLLPDDDPLADYIYQRMGDLALNFNDYPAAQKWYQAALNATGDIGFQVSLREGMAAAYLGQKKFGKAISQYQNILDTAKIPAYRAKINRLIGEAYLQADNRPAAQKQWQQTLDQYPETFDAYLSLSQMVKEKMPVDDFQRGYIDYHGGSAYQPAVEAMDRFLASKPKNKADQALWISALSQRALGNYQDAIARFDRLIATYPDSPLWAEAHIQKARAFGWQGKVEQAVKTYRNFAAQNPEHPLAQEALYKAALIEFQDDQFETAYKNFHRFAGDYPLSLYADDARYWGGLAAFQLQDYAAAEAEWAALLQDYPAGEFGRAASYWQAKTLLLMGKEEQGQTLLQQLTNQPFNYYSLRARDLLKDRRLAPNAPLDLSPPGPAEQKEAEVWLAHWLGLSQSANLNNLDKQIQGDPAFIRADALLNLGLRADALDEYESVMNVWRNNPLAMYQLALAFQERGVYRLSILSAAELVKLSPAVNPTDVPKFIRRLVYPVYYQDLILPQADDLELDPALIFALIRQESLFEPQAQSFAGARGLAQIMPATGEDIAKRSFAQNYSLDDLWRPVLNVQFGSWYIKQMLNFLDGNQIAALAAYNAGPGRVQTWIAYPGAEDLDVFAALIPLAEPREYIRRIYLNLAAYREIYGE